MTTTPGDYDGTGAADAAQDHDNDNDDYDDKCQTSHKNYLS